MKQTSQAVSVEKKENLAIIRFSRPKERNPLSIEVLQTLNQILDEIETEPVIIFTGTDDVFA
jgi:enoyl-CoA hydratase/carnithine racemase